MIHSSVSFSSSAAWSLVVLAVPNYALAIAGILMWVIAFVLSRSQNPARGPLTALFALCGFGLLLMAAVAHFIA